MPIPFVHYGKRAEATRAENPDTSPGYARVGFISGTDLARTNPGLIMSGKVPSGGERLGLGILLEERDRFELIVASPAVPEI